MLSSPVCSSIARFRFGMASFSCSTISCILACSWLVRLVFAVRSFSSLTSFLQLAASVSNSWRFVALSATAFAYWLLSSFDASTWSFVALVTSSIAERLSLLIITYAATPAASAVIAVSNNPAGFAAIATLRTSCHVAAPCVTS